MKSRPGSGDLPCGKEEEGTQRERHKDRPHHVTGQIEPQDFKMVEHCNLGPTGNPRGSNMWKWWPLCCASGQLAVPVNVSLRSGRAGRQHCVRLSRGLKTTRDVKDESVNWQSSYFYYPCLLESFLLPILGAAASHLVSLLLFCLLWSLAGNSFSTPLLVIFSVHPTHSWSWYQAHCECYEGPLFPAGSPACK